MPWGSIRNAPWAFGAFFWCSAVPPGQQARRTPFPLRARRNTFPRRPGRRRSSNFGLKAVPLYAPFRREAARPRRRPLPHCSQGEAGGGVRRALLAVGRSRTYSQHRRTLCSCHRHYLLSWSDIWYTYATARLAFAPAGGLVSCSGLGFVLYPATLRFASERRV